MSSASSPPLGQAAAFLLINPGPTALISEVDAAITRIANDGFPATLDAWRTLRPLGLRLAYPGEATARRDAYYAARANLIDMPDGACASTRSANSPR